jgi:DNA-binding response OmpR family regulator
MSVVLLIDNEPSMGSLVTMCLADLGAHVVQVPSIEAALDAARDNPVDAVLLDIALDGEDGLTELPRLRKERSLATAPVIAFSVHDSRKREALRLGASGFIKKPFKSEDLRRAVRGHLG